MKTRFRNLIKGLSIIFALMIVHTTKAQLVPKNDMEEQAARLVQAYQADVGMTVEQASAVYEKIVATLAKQNEIKNSTASAAEKKKSLTDLSKQETEQIGTILDATQMKNYKKMKKTLQPIE